MAVAVHTLKATAEQLFHPATPTCPRSRPVSALPLMVLPTAQSMRQVPLVGVEVTEAKVVRVDVVGRGDKEVVEDKVEEVKVAREAMVVDEVVVVAAVMLGGTRT
jgi:hypothetical protein